MSSNNMIISLYEDIERSAKEHTPLYNFGSETSVTPLFSSSGQIFLINDLFWIDEHRNVYRAIIEPQFHKKDIKCGMYVFGSMTLDGFSSGKTDMFRKENRYSSIL